MNVGDVTVVSAIYGRCDSLKPLPPDATGIMFTDDPTIMFTDDPTMRRAHGWEVRYDPMVHLGSPRLRAKFWKVMVHLAVSGTVLWIDGSIQLNEQWSEMLDELGDDEAVFFRHPTRDCIYEEVVASWEGRAASYRGQPLDAQVDHYRSWFPQHGGLIAAGCSLRSDTPAVQRLNERWWTEICRWSTQDQLSLTPTLWTMPELRWHYFSRLMPDQSWFELFSHISGDTGETP